MNHAGEVGIGKNDDRRPGKCRFGTNLFDDVQAGHLRQDQVEEDQVRLEGAHGAQAVLAVGGGGDMITLGHQLVVTDVADDGVIFDDKDSFHVRRRPGSRPDPAGWRGIV